jgi:hypothetical protein
MPDRLADTPRELSHGLGSLKKGRTAMILKKISGCASALILMLATITTNAVAGGVREGTDWNMGQRHAHMALGSSDQYARHTLARGLGYAGVPPTARADWSEAPHLVRVGPKGYWVTSSWGCWIDEAQDRIVDCDSGNR